MYLKISEVKKTIHEQGFRIRGEALDALNRQIGYLVSIAIKRANQDRRSSVESQDFIHKAIIETKNKWGIVE